MVKEEEKKKKKKEKKGKGNRAFCPGTRERKVVQLRS